MKYTFLLLCSLFYTFSFAQKEAVGGIRGFVLDAKSKEPMVAALVTIKELKNRYTVTDVNGFYNFNNVPAGTVTLVYKVIGYKETERAITVKNGAVENISVTMEDQSLQLKNVDITSSKQVRKSRVNVSTVNISQKEIKKLPSMGGEPDMAQYLQMLPGVVSSGDQGGQTYIRGGTPVMTKYLMDGITVFNPFHSIGFFSTYETEFIKNVDVYAGGFSARYGNRMSAVVDVTTKDGNKNKLGAKLSMNPWASKVLLEGPLMKPNAKGNSISFLFSTKYSYLDKSSKVFYPYAAGGELPYSFTDVFGKITCNIGSGNKVNFTGFNFNDRANFNGVSDVQWKNRGFGANFALTPTSGNIFMNTRFSYSNYTIGIKEAGNREKNSTVNGFDVGLDFSSYLANQGDVKYGVEVSGYSTLYNFINPLGIKIDENQYTTEFAAYTAINKTIGKLVIEPSVRGQYYGSISEFSVEPRLGLKFNVTNAIRLKGATGLYSQNLISSKSDRDVVNLFNGFLSGTDQTLKLPNGNDAKSRLQKAAHFITGVEIDLPKNIFINIEPYYIKYLQVQNVNRNKLYAADPNYLLETGNSMGVDFSAKYDSKKWNLYAAYSLAKNTRYDGKQTYPPFFDRRHNVNVLATYTTGKNKDWEFSARWNFGSGFPFTKTKGFFEEQTTLSGTPNPILTGNGSLGIIYDSQLNGGRLPYYHRLDLSAKHILQLSPKAKAEISASVTNAYDRENIFYFDRVRYTRVNQLPVLPSIGVALSF